MNYPDDRVFAVHTTRADNIGAVTVIYDTEPAARGYARERSTDYGVLASAVTSFVLNQLGTRTPVCWYRDGKEQPIRKWCGTAEPLHLVERIG